MAFPDIAHYTQRPTSWLRLGGITGAPGYLPHHFRTRVEIARSQFYVPSGERGVDIDQPVAGVPLGFTQDLVVLAYYELDNPELAGNPFTLDDDDWLFSLQVGTSVEQLTLRDGTEWDEEPDTTIGRGSWALIEALFTIGPGKNESFTVPGQPGDGTGIQRLSLGHTQISTHRPASMGGPSQHEWIRAIVRAPTAGISLKSGHTFTVRYFANKYMWERYENPFWTGDTNRQLIKTVAAPGVPSVKSWFATKDFSLEKTDLDQRASQVKASDA